MKIEYEVNIMCSEDAETNIFDSRELEYDKGAWDINQEISGIEPYFETEAVCFKKNTPISDYVLRWSLRGADLLEEELIKILKGTIVILNRLEGSFNSEYYNGNISLLKPRYAFFIEKVMIDYQKYDSILFDDFNQTNAELQEKF